MVDLKAPFRFEKWAGLLAGFGLRGRFAPSKISKVFFHRPVPVRRHAKPLCALLLCLVCPGLLCAATPPLPSYFLRVWQTENGLPDNAVTTIVQTHDGYLWLGTYDGLARFDGASFTVFDNNNTPEMSSSRIISLFEDGEGNLWIGHETGELTRYRDGHFYAVKFNATWEDRKISGIGAYPADKIWVLNEEGRLAGINGEMITVPNAGASTRAASLVANEHGAFWVIYGGQMFTLNQGRLAQVTPSNPPPSYVEAICPRSDGGLWVISDGRLRKWSGHEWTDDLGPVPWGQGSVIAMLETRSGCLAVGTLNQGLYLIFPGRGVLHFNRANGFPHDWVRCLYEDREGTLWAGTGSGGLVALRAGKVETLNPPDHWQGRGLLSVTAAHDGVVWIGTEGAGLYRLQNDAWTRFTDADGLSNLFVWSVAEDARGRIWAGTWGGGMFLQQGNRFVPAPGLESVTAPMPAILHANDGSTWIGTAVGLLHERAGVPVWYGRKDGLNLPDVRVVVEDRDGGVWFGMMGGGLGHLHDGVLHQFEKKDGLSSDYVQCLHLDTDGVLWIGTYGGGLDRLKQGRFACISSSQGLPNNFVCDIEDDGRGNFWISSHGGICRIQKEELTRCADGQAKSVSCLSYGKGDGMPTLECSGGLQPAGCRTADGRLWFPTSRDLVVVDPADVKTNQLAPPVLVEEMLVDNQLVTPNANDGPPARIPPGRQRFEFRYTALSFVAPEKVSFHYRLEGLERDWVDAGTKRNVIYSHVPPGRYTFHVIACNSDGVWNDTGATLAFAVQPYFWQVWWFRVAASLAAAAVLAGTVLWETRRRMHHKLERVERLRTIEHERARIAQDIHDNLGANLTRISLLSEAVQSELDNPIQAATQLERIYSTARELTRAMDEIVWAVNPQYDTLDSLANYLGNFAQEFLGSLDIRCRLDIPLELPPRPVTAEVRHNLFLAFKEALHNVVKHAAASEVRISLEFQTDFFVLIIRDNGRGFAPDAREQTGRREPDRIVRGHGLTNMRERLAKNGGRCEIESSPGSGTEVKFVVAVSAAAL